MPAHACSLVWRGTLLVVFWVSREYASRRARLVYEPRSSGHDFGEKHVL
jgi:hypothetical protein